MIKAKLAARMSQLVDDRVPFVLATVVRARRPTSVRPGDTAVVLPDGTIEGFVGGQCAESSVRLYCAASARDRRGDAAASGPGARRGRATRRRDRRCDRRAQPLPQRWGARDLPRAAAARCADRDRGRPPRSPGRVEKLASRVWLRRTVLARADQGASLPAQPRSSSPRTATTRRTSLSAALSAGVPYVALVASPKRGEAVRASLDLPAELFAALHTPAGLDIGARTPEEIAISILAELIVVQHADPAPGRPAAGEVFDVVGTAAGEKPADGECEPSEVALPGATAVDPVCGMTVAITASTPRLEVSGSRVYFCGAGCRDAFAARHVPDASTK